MTTTHTAAPWHIAEDGDVYESDSGQGGAVIFFPGIHQPSDAHRMPRAFISVNRLSGEHGRIADFAANDWIMDSGAFSTIATHGFYPDDVDAYATQIRRWRSCGNLLAAVAQDFMCEDAQLAKTALQVRDHHNFTCSRYENLIAEDCGGVYIMPVLQGRTMGDYLRHLAMYEERGHLANGAWVGVGSVCKRNTDPLRIEMILAAIKEARPDLRLHGFGVKTTSLAWSSIRDLLYSADSMAWSLDARRARGRGDLTRSGNDWREAAAFVDKIERVMA